MYESEKVKVKSLSRVQLLATPWTAAHQAPPSMGFSRQEYWIGVPLPSLSNVASGINRVISKYLSQEFQLSVIQYITSSSDLICPVQSLS